MELNSFKAGQDLYNEIADLKIKIEHLTRALQSGRLTAQIGYIPLGKHPHQKMQFIFRNQDALRRILQDELAHDKQELSILEKRFDEL